MDVDRFHVILANLIISDELARKYFNREDVVGEQITQLNFGREKEFTIAGVFKKWPLNSSFGFEAIALLDNYWDRRIHVPGGVDHPN